MKGGLRLKRLLTLMTAAVFMFGMATLGFATDLKCLKCHKGEKTIDKMAARAKVVTDVDLHKTLREGPKAGMHKPLTDADINEAVKVLKLKKV